MSVKITISTTTSAELEEILKALYPVQIRRKYRLLKRAFDLAEQEQPLLLEDLEAK